MVVLKIEVWARAKSSTVNETRYEISQGAFGFDAFVWHIRIGSGMIIGTWNARAIANNCKENS